MLLFCACLGIAVIGINISAGRHVSAMSLAEAANFISASINPELALTAGAQFVILSNQPSVGIKCTAMQCLVGIEQDAFAGNQCFLSCCSNVMEFGVGTCGMRVGWRGSCRWG